MRVYFSAARAYREDYGSYYEKISQVLEKNGLIVTDNGRLKSPSGFFLNLKQEDKEKLYKTMIHNIDKADISIFEATFPSTLHIGHEITIALEKGKPVIVLYLEGKEPILFKGLKDSRVIWVEYNSTNLAKKLHEALIEAKRNSDVRFNFFVSPKILSYLDWIAKNRMVPRAVFLRTLIEREMKKDHGFGE
jgi:hypothetical protein